MLSGTVANWSRDFGFLRRSEGPDVFVHKRRLPPGIRLHNGDTVTFSVHQEEGGKPEAVNIVLVSKKLSRELAQPAQVARRRPGVMAELTAGEPEGLKEPPPGSDGRKLFVYFNKESVDVNSLRRLGERHGRVINCHLAGGNGKKAHAGYGYIEFASKGEAVAAQGALDGAKWDEFEVKKLQVNGPRLPHFPAVPLHAHLHSLHLQVNFANEKRKPERASNGERLSNVSNYNERTSATSFVSDDEDGFPPYAACAASSPAAGPSSANGFASPFGSPSAGGLAMNGHTSTSPWQGAGWK